jgi:RNA polymerase sigma-70 factor (ECF subfamily)
MNDPQAGFDRLLAELRPRLHRHCARMTGSVIDGEDVLQEALAKAIEAYPRAGSIANPEGWLFRIAHNAALDFLRRRARQEGLRGDEDLDVIAEPDSEIDRRQEAAASLHTLMRLPVTQRGSVILMDVLGHSLEEVSAVLDTTVPAVKAALHRGRIRLRELAAEPDDRSPPALTDQDRRRLAAYVARFNARDFDALRALLADEVKVEVVNRTRLNGRGEAGRYFTNYGQSSDWRLAPGLVEGRPAVLVHHPDDPGGRPLYFILLDWSEERLMNVRDFRYARYVIDDAELILDSPQGRDHQPPG